MALQVWLPLNKENDFSNQGLMNIKATNSGATYISTGKTGGSYTFGDGNASSKGVSIDSNLTSLGEERSICAWVNPAGNHLHYSGAIASSGNWNTSNGRWAFCVNQSNTGFTGMDDGYANYYSTSIPVGEWTHLCVTVKNNVTRFYKNGVYLGESSRGGALYSDASNTMIGRETYAGGYFTFNGKISDVRIYDHCLSPKEVSDIAKGLVMHFLLNDQVLEETINIDPAKSDISISKSYITGMSIPSGASCTLIEFDGYKCYKVEVNKDDISSWYGCYMSANPISFGAKIGDTVTRSVMLYVPSGQTIPSHFTESIEGGSSNQSYNQYDRTRFDTWQRVWMTGTLTGTSNNYLHYICAVTSGSVHVTCYFRDFQMEINDQPTRYTKDSNWISYDSNVYIEPDKSRWVRIAHHNNPAEVLFSSTDDFPNGVYIDQDRWFSVYKTIKLLSSYEFMVKQKTTSDSEEVKYRWIQNTSPLIATYNDVQPSAVTRVTSSGYTDGGYGGLYVYTYGAHLAIANSTDGNWYGAFGCWTAWNSGIPGYPNTCITTGYMDLYVRIPNEFGPFLHDCSGYNRNAELSGSIDLEYSSPRYDACIKFMGHNSYFLAKNPFYSNIQPMTISFWFKPNSSNDSYNTIISNTYPHGGFWISVNSESQGLWSYNSGLYVHGRTGLLPNEVWYHIVWQYKGNNEYQWYLNGEAVETYSSGTLKAPVFTEYLNIGGCYCSDSSTSSSRYDQYGSISDLRIYSSILTDEDIKDLYSTSVIIDNNGNLLPYSAVEQDVEPTINKSGIVESNTFIEVGDKLKVLSDGSLWVQLLHHNAPASNLFSSSNCWNYNDNSNLFSALFLLKTTSWINNNSEYEFLACEKLESSSEENQYRWKQTSNPSLSSTIEGFTAISGGGYSSGLKTNNSYGCMHNGNTWWCCCGSYTPYQGGIPGFGGVVKTGYLDLYIRVPEETTKGAISGILEMYSNSIVSNQIIEI